MMHETPRVVSVTVNGQVLPKYTEEQLLGAGRLADVLAHTVWLLPIGGLTVGLGVMWGGHEGWAAIRWGIGLAVVGATVATVANAVRTAIVRVRALQAIANAIAQAGQVAYGARPRLSMDEELRELFRANPPGGPTPLAPPEAR